uniref:SCP domain-containing protein n=1 Tax=Panagrolaimus sp. PS1159 TaxID=55785 RepID=A0AC35GZR7_9BILA
MNCAIHLFVLLSFAVYAIVFGQQSTTTCSNSNSLMTSASRQKILNVLNLARNKLESGQLLLNNGKYAVQAASLSDLTWSCEMEEEISEWIGEQSCDLYLSSSNLQSFNMTWYYQRMDNSNIETFIDLFIENNPMLQGITFTQFSRHNIYLQTNPTYVADHIHAFSDKVQHIACAIQTCDANALYNGIYGNVLNKIFCKVSLTEDLKFGDEIYQVSSSANYIPPSQDVICPSKGRMIVEYREAVLEKINLARYQISEGLYEPENGGIILQPKKPLSPLVWSCEDEYLMAKSFGICETVYDAATEFKKNVAGVSFNNDYNEANVLNWWSELGTEFFFQNPNLNFLTEDAIYATQYPAAFALSNQAETVACRFKVCPTLPTQSFDFVCRVKPSLQIG